MTTSKSLGPRSIVRSLVAWSIIVVGLVLIYLNVGMFLALLVTPSPGDLTLARYIVDQFGLILGLSLIILGQWIGGRRPRLKARRLSAVRRLLRLGKVALLIAIIAAYQIPIGASVGSIVPVFAWSGLTHREQITSPAIKKAASYYLYGGYPYKELEAFLYPPAGLPDDVRAHYPCIIRGAADEDDCGGAFGARDNNHFYTPPDKGLKWEWYFSLRKYFDPSGCDCAKPSDVSASFGDSYPDAYRWARNGAGTNDVLSWYGALDAYDYTEGSKQVAYTRFGHVLHLLEDMAEPDHAGLKPHPGSSKKSSEIIPKLNALVWGLVGLFGGGIIGAIIGASVGYVVGLLVDQIVGERYGFEALIRDCYAGPLPSPGDPEYYPSLRAYFDKMATEAMVEAKASGLKLDPALGVNALTIPELHIPYLDITVWPPELKSWGWDEMKLPLLPAIDPDNSNDYEPYFDLADKTGSKAIGKAAGLAMWFYDIVNYPPYVRQVNITQGGELKYHALWNDHYEFDSNINTNRIKYRELKILRNETIQSGKPAEITVEFGPYGGTEKNPIPKRMDTPFIRVGGTDVQIISLVDNKCIGTFTPQVEGCKEESMGIIIRAHDLDRHHYQGQEDDAGIRLPSAKDYQLDSDPATPAKLTRHGMGPPPHWPFPPYSWDPVGEYAYKPGPDDDHYKVTVRPDFQLASVTPTQASLLPLAGQSFHFTITLGNGPADVKLKALGVPPGAQAEFYPSASVHVPPPPQTANVILKITVSSATPVGTYKIQIVDEGYTPPPGILALQPCYPTVTLTVKPSTPLPLQPDFTIHVDPSSGTVKAGFSTTTNVIIGTVSLPMYGNTVSLSLSPPSGFKITFTPPQTSEQCPFTRSMQVDVAPTVSPGNYPITITGTGGDGIIHATIFTVFVLPAPPADFTIAVNPSSSTVSTGPATTVQVTVTPTAGYNQMVTLSYLAPTGFTVFFGQPVGIPSFTTPMYISVLPTVQGGNYPITITGTGSDGKTHFVIFTAIVPRTPVFTLPPFNFAASVSTSSQSVPQGQSATYVVTITLVSGSTQAVSLDLRGLPSGATFYFRPNVGNPTFTSTLLVTTTTRTPLGDHVLTIVASGGGVVKSTTVRLQVVPPPIRAGSKDCGALALSECTYEAAKQPNECKRIMKRLLGNHLLVEDDEAILSSREDSSRLRIGRC